jgi:hypothetical protein
MRFWAIIGMFMTAITVVDMGYGIWSGSTGRVMTPTNSMAYELSRALTQ